MFQKESPPQTQPRDPVQRFKLAEQTMTGGGTEQAYP